MFPIVHHLSADSTIDFVGICMVTYQAGILLGFDHTFHTALANRCHKLRPNEKLQAAAEFPRQILLVALGNLTQVGLANSEH